MSIENGGMQEAYSLVENSTLECGINVFTHEQTPLSLLTNARVY